MSGLIFKGDVISSAGEYLPAPYINKITVESDANDSDNSVYNLEIYIFVDDFEYIEVFENGVIEGSKDAYKKSLEKLYYYIIALSGVETEIYDKLISRDLNPLKFYNDFETGEYPDSYVAMVQVDAFDEEPSEIYDESGNRILVYRTQLNSSELDSVFRTEQGEQVSGKNIEYIMSFCSTYEYSYGSDNLNNNFYSAALLELQTGDLSYEKIYVSSDSNELSVQDTLKFYNSQNIIYDKIPLSSIERMVYTINLIDHDEIKESINNLLNEYADLYNTESGYENLKAEMNSIYSVLELYGNEYDIVYRLDEVRRNFSDKTPIKPVGKLYKRFAKRLYEINRSIIQSEVLNKKITYNSKLIDFRITTTGDTQTSESENETYIYTDPNLFSNLSIEEDTMCIVAGYFLFDYEKAIRKNSVISQYIDVNKLETLGLNIPYESYYIQNVSLNYNDAYIIGRFSEDSKYPYTDSIAFVNDNNEFLESGYLSDSENDINNSIYGYQFPASPQEAASLGYATSVVNRSYSYYPSDEFAIKNYRLMLFEVLEYRNESNNNSYNTTISIEDDTASYYQEIYNTYKEFYDDFSDYYDKAIEACAYNHDLNKFNEYFIQSLLSNYSQDSDATWYSAPAIYCLYADIFYNSFEGDLEIIEEESKKIASAVNPYTGDIESINTFKEKMDELKGTMELINIKVSDEEQEIEQKLFESQITIFEPQINDTLSEVQNAGGEGGLDVDGESIQIIMPVGQGIESIDDTELELNADIEGY